MSPFRNETPQEVAALHIEGTELVDFIRERVNSKCRQTGESQEIIRPKIRKEILAGLARGRLIAIGRNKCSDDQFSPQLIPLDFWHQAQPLMADYQFKSVSAHYFDIKVLETEAPAPTPKLKSIDAHDAIKKPRGRPSSKKEVYRLLEDLRNDPEFLGLPSREAQACEVRARLCGEEHRYHRDMKDYKDESLKRWIGNALG